MTDKSHFTFRRAKPADAPRMMPLLNEYIRQAEILPRTEEDVCRSIREWVVAEAATTQLVGMGSLLVMSANLAEIRSLVIHPNYHGQGIGRQIVRMLLDEARMLDIERVIALTRKPDFFMKLGFELTRLEKLPRKIRRDCVFCVKFHACDEVALTIHPEEIGLPDQPRAEKNGATPPSLATALAGSKSI